MTPSGIYLQGRFYILHCTTAEKNFLKIFCMGFEALHFVWDLRHCMMSYQYIFGLW